MALKHNNEIMNLTTKLAEQSREIGKVIDEKLELMRENYIF